MSDYSPKRRTAVVFTGSGVAGAYQAGALKALDEAGVKLDFAVGSGIGTLTAAFAAAAGGEKLYGPDGFWADFRWSSLYRLRPSLRIASWLLGLAGLAFLLPVLLAIVLGALLLPTLLVDWLVPGFAARLIADHGMSPAALRAGYTAALAVPTFGLALLGLLVTLGLWLRHRHRIAESWEHCFSVAAGRTRVAHYLGEAARGTALATASPSVAELGKRYVALAGENLGQPGFRQLILCAGDLDLGGPLVCTVLGDTAQATLLAARGRGNRGRPNGATGIVDLRTPGLQGLLFEAVVSGILVPFITPPSRPLLPKEGPYAGETHRLVDATWVGGCGLAEALAAGAEQVILVSAVPEEVAPAARRRGLRALAEALLTTLERQSLERELATTERINRMVATLGHDLGERGKAWQDPATGRLYRTVSLYMVRPQKRLLNPLELDGASDPITEAHQTPADLMELGYRDAYRLFIEPVVGAAPAARRVQTGAQGDASHAGLKEL